MRRPLFVLALAFLTAKTPDKPEAPPPYRIELADESAGPSHSLALGRVRRQTLAFVADEDGSAILTFDTDAMHFVSRTAVPGKPSSVRVLPSGEIAVTLRDVAEVSFLEATHDGLRVVAIVPVCDEPVSLGSSGDELFVVCGWGHALDTVSITTHQPKSHVELSREPRAVVADPNGKTLYVSHAEGSRLSVINRASGKVTEKALSLPGLPPVPVSLSGFGMDRLFGDDQDGELTGGRHRVADGQRAEQNRPRFASQGFSLALVSRGTRARLLLPETLVAPNAPPTTNGKIIVAAPMRSVGYGGGGGFLAVDRSSTVPYLATLDTATMGGGVPLNATGASRCLLPRAATSLPDGRVFVTCLGSDEVVAYNGLASEPDDNMLMRAHVAHGPTGIAYESSRIFVWSAFDRVLTRLDDGFDSFDVASDTKERAPTPFEVGRRLFHRTDSFMISGDGRACASCHPDGRDDGLVWSSPDGPRQTPMLAGRLADTPPFGWTGEAATVREHLKKTFERLGGSGLDDSSLYALLTYCAQMTPPPRETHGSAAARVAHGKSIFESYDAGCTDCHSSSRGFSDGERHNVGSMSVGDADSSFETPSLRHVGETAPYFHDGRFATLEDLLRGSPQMADMSAIPENDIEDLAAYLRTL